MNYTIKWFKTRIHKQNTQRDNIPTSYNKANFILASVPLNIFFISTLLSRVKGNIETFGCKLNGKIKQVNKQTILQMQNASTRKKKILTVVHNKELITKSIELVFN